MFCSFIPTVRTQCTEQHTSHCVLTTLSYNPTKIITASHLPKPLSRIHQILTIPSSNHPNTPQHRLHTLLILMLASILARRSSSTLTLSTMNQNLRHMEYAVRGPIVIKADEISKVRRGVGTC